MKNFWKAPSNNNNNNNNDNDHDEDNDNDNDNDKDYCYLTTAPVLIPNPPVSPPDPSLFKAAPCNGHMYRNKFVILANASAASKDGSVSRPPRLSLTSFIELWKRENEKNTWNYGR